MERNGYDFGDVDMIERQLMLDEFAAAARKEKRAERMERLQDFALFSVQMMIVVLVGFGLIYLTLKDDGYDERYHKNKLRCHEACIDECLGTHEDWDVPAIQED